MNPVLETVVGNRTAALVLLFIANYGEGHAQRIARTYETGLNMTQRQLKRLESGGVLVSRMVGNSRQFSFNKRNPIVRDLRALLKAELDRMPEADLQRWYRQRQRPRRTGKPL